MTRSFRSVLCNLVAAMLLLTGAAIAPGAVLCIGPGNHCHVETVLGTACNERVEGRGPSAPRLPDGCPEGSKDFRLKVDSHRGDVASVLTQTASVVRYTPARIAAMLLQTGVSPSSAQRDFQSPSSVVLRL